MAEQQRHAQNLNPRLGHGATAEKQQLGKEAVQIGSEVTLVTGITEKGVGKLVGEYAAYGRFLSDPTVTFTVTGLYDPLVFESIPLFQKSPSMLTVMNHVLKVERERKPPWIAAHAVWVVPHDRVSNSDHVMQIVEASGAVPVDGHYEVELMRRLM